MKDQVQLIHLFNKYLANECSLEEVKELMAYFNAEQSEILEESILDEFENLAFETEIGGALPPRVFENIKARIATVKSQPVPKVLWTKWIAAASVLLVLGLGLFFYKTNGPVSTQSIYVNDINPGNNGATLTLANGEKISINEVNAGKIAQQSGVQISKTADGQIIYLMSGEIGEQSRDGEIAYNELATTRGEQTQLRLPDGSVVFLNAASSLKFPASFARLKERKVELTGEAYFEVAKDKLRPFIVKNEKQEVKVLGTHFNVNAYQEEPAVKTTLLEGSIRLSVMQDTRLLKPGQQAAYTNNKLSIAEVDVDKAVAWKNAKFVFEDENIESVMRKLARWYNVEVFYQDNVSDRTFTGSISRYDKISKILDKISYIEAVKFKVEGRRITVMK